MQDILVKMEEDDSSLSQELLSTGVELVTLTDCKCYCSYRMSSIFPVKNYYSHPRIDASWQWGNV